MAAAECLDADDVQRLVHVWAGALDDHREVLNRLNVYPVPDGDTGTNMALTLQSVVAELPDGGSLTETCDAIRHGSLMGARGNSGVILSQILRELASAFVAGGGVDGSSLTAGLAVARDKAYQAVERPVEGTILTVVSAAAAAAAEGDDLSLLAVSERAQAAAADALEHTPELLPVLAEAGVVDAGGAGLVVLFDGLLNVVDGRAIPEPEIPAGPAPDLAHLHAHADVTDHDPGELRYEVMFLLEAPDDTIAAFKDAWAGIGDSIVVVGGDGLWNCHIHTNDIGASIEACLDAGRPRTIRVTDLHEQVEEERWVREAEAAQSDDKPAPLADIATAVVAVGTGSGVARIFRSLHVQEVVAGGQSMNPSTAQILEAVESCAADNVIVLPNNKNIIPVAEQVDGLTAKTVRVVPTRGLSEGFASLWGYDPESDADANLAAMSELAASVVSGEITKAVRDSACELGPIVEGDWIGIARDGIKAVSPDLADAAITLLAHLVDDHEIVNVIEGEGSSAGVTRAIREWLTEHHPDLEIEVSEGGQPLYPYLFGIE